MAHNSPSSYVDRGVSATKEDVHAAIAGFSLGLYPGAFCKIVEDVLGDSDYCNVIHADGAGTKSTIAYIQYLETGDSSVFRGIAQDSIVMNLDDMLCVGATTDFVVSNTIGRNAHRVDGAIVREIIAGYEEFAASMSDHGIRILLGGGETADLGDLVATVIVDSTIFARMRRADVVDCANISAGNVIVGLASYGQSTYETAWNSGIGSNGFTAARHMLMSKEYASAYPETYSQTMAEDDVYAGPYKLDDALAGSEMTVGEALLSPTRTYLPVARRLFEEVGSQITGVVQPSGGGQAKCTTFGTGLHYVKDNLFERQPIFDALAATGALSEKELYQVFNMGHRLEVFCNEAAVGDVIAIAKDFGIDAQVVGRVEASADGDNHLTILDRGNTFEF